MTGKERMAEAFTRGLTEGFPVVIPYVDIFIRDHWEQVTDEPWWVSRSWDIPALLRVQESLAEKLDLDWVEATLCPPRRWRETHTVKEQGGRFFLQDLATGRSDEIRKPPIGGEKVNWIDKPLVKSREDVDAYIPVQDHGKLIESGSLDYVAALVRRFGEEKFVNSPVPAPLWAAYHYMGFRGTLLSLFRSPALVEYLLERLTVNALETLQAYAEAGIDGVWIEDCLCSANEISLTHFKRFAVPYAERLISEVKKLGMKSIYYFCGDAHDRLGRIVEMQPDAVSLEESKKGFQIDIKWVDKVVDGRACIFGNLDAINLLSNAPRDELEGEIKRQIEVGRRTGKFVISLGSPVTPGTSVARVREYVDIARRLSYT
ncbi:MAG: uroporphyrinogen decarboxylase family protein [Candidatus Bathyarchaeia archaeon]